MSMACPNCSSSMITMERYGVEIDQCPTCKGVWLDRGELEKVANMQRQNEEDHYKKYHYDEYNEDDRENSYYGNDDKRERKRGFLDDLFGLFD